MLPDARRFLDPADAMLDPRRPGRIHGRARSSLRA
jgi:hypothetical protein